MKVEEDWDCCQRERRIGQTSLVRVPSLTEQKMPLVIFQSDQQKLPGQNRRVQKLKIPSLQLPWSFQFEFSILRGSLIIAVFDILI